MIGQSNQRWDRRRFLGTAAGVLGASVAAERVGADERPKAETRLPRAKPEDIGLDSRRLQVAYDLLEKWTTGPDAPVPGGAILVGRNGKVVAPRFYGRQGP